MIEEGEQCEGGECCQACKFRLQGYICKDTNGSCDKEERCTGSSAQCPTGIFVNLIWIL